MFFSPLAHNISRKYLANLVSVDRQSPSYPLANIRYSEEHLGAVHYLEGSLVWGNNTISLFI